ncbi:uncharacterized protein JN550_009981 [Neoarthrinium moseri]|uniref:uncharacterized protein n=1 Tax=Neoarthrinium moseri TaxID=1658444 RepID=UPI001FDB8BE2|nr:uncharacterized protein JN550_009981 [Neoarthrinium moseri]KAI1862834.1 hypothetical protein JN550_009981 [Neoarthrinium moseri]
MHGAGEVSEVWGTFTNIRHEDVESNHGWISMAQTQYNAIVIRSPTPRPNGCRARISLHGCRAGPCMAGGRDLVGVCDAIDGSQHTASSIGPEKARLSTPSRPETTEAEIRPNRPRAGWNRGAGLATGIESYGLRCTSSTFDRQSPTPRLRKAKMLSLDALPLVADDRGRRLAREAPPGFCQTGQAGQGPRRLLEETGRQDAKQGGKAR